MEKENLNFEIMKEVCLKFIRHKQVEKVKGLTVSGFYLDGEGEKFFFPSMTKEEYLKEYVEETFVYYFDKDYDRPFYELEDLDEYLYDEIFHYIDTEMTVTDETHDKIADFFEENGYSILEEYFKEDKEVPLLK